MNLRNYCKYLPFLFVLLSCNDEKVAPSGELDYLNYFPLKTGQWTEFTADSIVHLDSDDIFEIDTAIRYYQFQLREVVDTSFIDGENEMAYVILRYKRSSDSLPWMFVNSWTAKINPYSAHRVEDNIRFVRLSFPFSESSTWNGNAFNTYPVEEYTYENLYEPIQFGTLSFDSSVTVVQNDFVSLINRIQKKEIYAPRAGMIYKRLDSLNTANTPNGFVILNGTEFTLTVTDYSR